MSTQLAGPPGACCIRVVQHSGVPRGSVETIANLQTYVSRPPGGAPAAKIVLFFADVFGALYVNAKLAMDYWASHGYLVLGPDYFEGDSRAIHEGTPGWDVDEWVVPFRTTAPKVTAPWLEFVREKYGGPNTEWFTVGYCFGAPFVMDLLATEWVSAGAFAHPAFLDEDHFSRVKKPLLMCCAEDDFTFPLPSRRRAEDILIELKTDYFIQVFGGASHGFGTRADPNHRADTWAKQESARGILDWFEHHAR